MKKVYGYKSRLKERFNNQIKQILTKHKLTELIIVLDLNTAFILSNIFKITELVAMKINFIERLEKKRKKMNKHALYFITPNKQSGLALSKDFEKEQQQPQYRRIHILFSSFADKNLLKIIATNPFLLKKLAKNSIKQFYCSAKILGQNLVDLGVSYLPFAYGKQNQSEQLRRSQIARKLIEYIANTNEVNTVKIYYKKSDNFVCERMAQELQSAVKNYLGILIQNKSSNISKNAKDITFLLLDRSIDPITPLLHYFTYEALLFDLFDISMVGKAELKDQESYSYQQIQNQSYQIYRYRHISEALQKLPAALQREKDKLDAIKTGGHQNINIQLMNQRIQDLKSNIDKLEMIWKRFQQLKLTELSQLELSLATGLTEHAENTSSSKLIQQVRENIKQSNTSPTIKLRLAMLCLCCIKMSQKDYIQLLDLFGEKDKKILLNLNALGVTYDSTLSKSTKTITKEQQNIAKERMEKTGMPLNRYTSILELVVPLFLRVLTNPDPNSEATIDPNIFGLISCSVFKNQSQTKFDPTKIGIAVVGGMSWAEVSALRCIDQVEEAVLLTDSMYSPEQFITALSLIDVVK